MSLEPKTAGLVLAARAGQTEAFAQLVLRHQSEIRNFLRRLAREDWQLADDLAQDSFLQAYRSLENLHRPEKFRSWVFGIAYRKFIDHTRRCGSRKFEAVSFDVAAVDAPNPEGGPDYETLLSLLQAGDAAIVDLIYRKGFSHTEAAEALQLPLGTVKTKIRGALQTLQQILKRRHE